MAAVTANELNAVSKQYYDDKIEQSVYEKSPLFYKLKKDNKVTISGGERLQWPVRLDELGTAGAVNPKAQVNFQAKQTRYPAQDEWGFYVAHNIITWDERAKNAGKGKIIDLAKDRAQEISDDMNNKLYEDLFATTQGDNAITPLGDIVDSSTSYAGLDPATYSNWAAQEDSSTTTLTLYGSGSLSAIENDAMFGDKGPNFHITTRDLQSKFESLLEPQKRYEDKEMADAGFKSVSWHGYPVVSDVFVPANTWYGLDLDAIKLVAHSDYGFGNVSEWMDFTPLGYVNALGKVYSLTLQFQVMRRRTHFKFTSLSATS